MKTLYHPRNRSSKGAALMIVLAFVVLLTGVALAYFSRTATDRQLAQSSYNDTNADLLARSALDIVVGDFKQEIFVHPTPTPNPPYYIEPTRYGDASIANLIRRSYSGDPTGRTSSVPSTSPSANGRSISTARWNSHYLVPRLDPSSNAVDSTPVISFTAPDWVLVTAQGPNSAPAPNAVIGRYAFAVYDEGGLLDMSVAGYPGWTTTGGGCNPAPTPWLTNVGRKGTVGFADLTALPAAPSTFFPQSQMDNIVGWRNFATSQRTFTNFPTDPPGYSGESTCTKQDSYGDYLLYFGEPPFAFDINDQPVPISSYPFSAVYPATNSARTDQTFMTRQQLLRLRSSLGFSQNVLQYMGTFSRERNQPAPDWPFLGNNLSDGRFSLSNLDLVKPNPQNCNNKGKGKGQGKSRGRGHLCGEQADIVDLFGLLWVPSSALPPDPNGNPQPGRWRYINHVGKNWDPNPNPHGKINCWRGPKKQNDFFQILQYALNRLACADDQQSGNLARTFAIGASLIDQYDSDADDLDTTLTGNDRKWQTHTTIIEYAPNTFAYGMETSDVNYDAPGNQPGRRPYGAPNPIAGTKVINHAFTNIGEFGYAIDTSSGSQPTLNFSSGTSSDKAVLDFFGYNPVSSSYPRAGIVNLNTKNALVIAAILKEAAPTDGAITYVNQTQATNAADAIVAATGAQPALTRADVARLASVVTTAPFTTNEETRETIARALAELGQTRTWNLMVDVIAQTGRYAPGTGSVTDADKFTVEGEKRYWLHIALGRDLNNGQVDVLGTQLEEVTE
jgi:hypothetical protein